MKKAILPALLLSALVLPAPLLLAESQKERCAPNDGKGDMRCVNRHGHCVELFLDGEKTVPLSDEATGGRIAAMKVDDAVCWQVARSLPTKLRVSANGGGLVPTYVGDSLEKIGVNAWAVGGPAKGSGEAREIDDVELVPEGGSWTLKSESPLKAGEYVLVFRVFGSNNWDRQAVLVTLDPKLPSSDSGKPAK